jgi:peptidoglycan hydrolase CwlO-like protein
MTLELETLQMRQESEAANTQAELDKLTADLKSVEASLNQIKSKNDKLNQTIKQHSTVVEQQQQKIKTKHEHIGIIS